MLIDDLGRTSLPLDNFRKVMGIDPWHFWQMRTPDGCSGLYTHYRWLGDGYVARYDFAQAVEQAEEMLASYLNYWPGLRYAEREVVRMIKPRQVALYNRTPMKLIVKWERVQNTGKRTWTALDTAVEPVYNGSNDIVLTVAGVPDGAEVVVCYHDTFVPIRPIDVSVSAGTATIVIHRWLLADPELWDVGTEIDANNDNNLVQELDVYAVTYDTTQAILLAWEPEIQRCGCLELEQCAVCQGATHTACPGRGNYSVGAINWQVADYVSGAWKPAYMPYSRFPDLAYVSYQHGATPAPDPYMSNYWAQIVSHLAVALLDEADCGCGETLNAMRYWREDLGYSKDSSHQLGPADLDNPFGQRRGQIAAWKAVLAQVGEE